MHRVDDMTKWQDFPPVIKEFYDELSEIAQMSADDVQALRARNDYIVVAWLENNSQLNIPNPIYEFRHAFHNFPEIMDEISKQIYSQPFPIQCQAWPIALRGHDFISIAETGATGIQAFLLPALIHVSNQPKTKTQLNGHKALILTPTFELAFQVQEEVQQYSYQGIRSAVVYDAKKYGKPASQYDTDMEIIISTTTDLYDFLTRNDIDVRSVTFLVLFKVDLILQYSLEQEIIKILRHIRPDRQTIMTTTTWRTCVREFAACYMRNPIQIFIGGFNMASVHSVRQDIKIVKEEEKFAKLIKFIGEMDREDKTIIFVDREASADAISSELIGKNIAYQSIHGDQEQFDQEQALKDLKLTTANVLVATNVPSRSLGIHDDTVVFNYDMPKSMFEYVHRVGRTGRTGRLGWAISLVTQESGEIAGELFHTLYDAGQNVPVQLLEMLGRHLCPHAI